MSLTNPEKRANLFRKLSRPVRRYYQPRHISLLALKCLWNEQRRAGNGDLKRFRKIRKTPAPGRMYDMRYSKWKKVRDGRRLENRAA